MIKNLMNSVVAFSSTVNLGMVVRILVLLALVFAALAHPGSVMAQPIMGGSVG